MKHTIRLLVSAAYGLALAYAVGCGPLPPATVSAIEGGAVSLACAASGFVGIAVGNTSIGMACDQESGALRSLVDSLYQDIAGKLASAPPNDARFVFLYRNHVPIGAIRSDVTKLPAFQAKALAAGYTLAP
jgi:hypothetical protein